MTMSNRSAKFVSAIIASILAGTNFAAVAQNTAKEESAKETNAKETNAKTADTCLSGPKGPLPAGGHWYYRVDRATKRNCWYIGEREGQISARRAEGFDRFSRSAGARSTASGTAGYGQCRFAAAGHQRPQVDRRCTGRVYRPAGARRGFERTADHGCRACRRNRK
jgi:hypothetical protein